MSRRRVVFVTRRFWPLVGEAENAVAELTVALGSEGFHVTLLTPRWRGDWPASFVFENVRVVRLAKPATRWWGAGGFTRDCAKWLALAHNDVDLIVAHGAADVRFVIAEAQRRGVPSVLLPDEADPPSPPGPRGLFRSLPPVADSVVVSRRNRSDAWLDAGYSQSKIEVIAPGVAVPASPPSEELRRGARTAFVKAMPDSKLGRHTPLAVCLHALDNNPELPRLLNHWQQVVRRLPDAQLWMLGTGPQRGTLCNLADGLSLQGRVMLPGVLECCDELFACADLYVAVDGAGSHSLLQAMAAGLPIAAADTPEHRRYVTNNQHGLLFGSEDDGPCHLAMERLLTQPLLAAALGANARRRVAEEFSLQQRVTRFASLFTELIGGSRPRS